ncbi:MAG TPA: hypothetical protein VF905_00435 [Nitrospirota bacterium]
MSVILENDVTLFQMQERNVEAARDDTKEFLEDAFSSARGMVNGLAAGLIIWAVIIYLLMK